MQIPGPRGLGKLSKHSIERFIEDDMLTHAAALAYYVFFALFPFSIFLVALLGSLGIPGLFDWLLSQAEAALPPQAMGQVEQVIVQLRDQSQGWVLVLGITVGIWSASVAVRSLMNALNVAHGVEESRSIWKRYPLSFAYTIGLAILIIVASVLMLIGPQIMEWLADQIGIGTVFVTLWAWLRFPVATLLLMLAVAIVYYLAPSIDRSFRFISPGAVLAVAVWIAASIGFSYYVSNFSNYGAIYGSLSAVIVLLLYFFISASVLLLGAEVNAEIYRKLSEDKDAAQKTPDQGSNG